MRPRKKENLAPRLAACEALMLPDVETQNAAAAFANPQVELHLEIGCGKGGFICETAAANPQINFIAMEREANVIVSAMELAVRRELQNVRFVLDDADKCLDRLFAPESLACIYINFCDPWHKKRHAKRRLTHHNRLTIYRGLLCPGGELRFKSDNEPLYRFSLPEFEQAFPAYFTTEDLHASIYAAENIMTEYERRFSDLGQPIYSIRAKKPTE